MGESKMADTKPLLSFLVVATFFFAVDAASRCYYRSYYPYRYYSKNCLYGCCSSGCCSGSSSSAGTSVFLIAAGVIGGIVALSVLVAVVCCCIKKQGKSGRVVQPASQRHQVLYNRRAPNLSMVYAGGYTAPPPQPQYNTYLPPGGPLSGPPPYKPYEQPPPPYAYPDPAYPPGGNSNPSQPQASEASPGFSRPTGQQADPFAANGGFSQPGASPNAPSGFIQPSAPRASPFDVEVGSSQPPLAGFSQPPPPGFTVGPASTSGNAP